MKVTGGNKSKTNNVRKISNNRDVWGPVANWKEERNEGGLCILCSGCHARTGHGVTRSSNF